MQNALLFEAAGQRYALEAADIVEVIPAVHLRSLPGVPAYVAGVFRYRGVIVPVIDLSQLIGNTPAAARLSTRIILTRHVGANGQVHILGLRADKATDIMASDASAPMPSGVVAAEAPYLGGLSQQGGALVQFINVLQLLPTAVRDSLFVES